LDTEYSDVGDSVLSNVDRFEARYWLEWGRCGAEVKREARGSALK
jgi:hypothetical protein